MSARRPFQDTPLFCDNPLGLWHPLRPFNLWSCGGTLTPAHPSRRPRPRRTDAVRAGGCQRGRRSNEDRAVTLAVPSRRHSHPRTCVHLRIPVKTKRCPVNVLRERITQLIPLTYQRRRYDPPGHCVSTASLILELCAGPPDIFTTAGNSSLHLPRRPLRIQLRYRPSSSSRGLNTPKADLSSLNGSRCPPPTYRPVRGPKRTLSLCAGKAKEA